MAYIYSVFKLGNLGLNCSLTPSTRDSRPPGLVWLYEALCQDGGGRLCSPIVQLNGGGEANQKISFLPQRHI